MVHEVAGLFAAWVIIGVAMGSGLYEAAFASLVRLYGRDSRKAIRGCHPLRRLRQHHRLAAVDVIGNAPGLARGLLCMGSAACLHRAAVELVAPEGRGPWPPGRRVPNRRRPLDWPCADEIGHLARGRVCDHLVCQHVNGGAPAASTRREWCNVDCGRDDWCSHRPGPSRRTVTRVRLAAARVPTVLGAPGYANAACRRSPSF